MSLEHALLLDNNSFPVLTSRPQILVNAEFSTVDTSPSVFVRFELSFKVVTSNLLLTDSSFLAHSAPPAACHRLAGLDLWRLFFLSLYWRIF